MNSAGAQGQSRGRMQIKSKMVGRTGLALVACGTLVLVQLATQVSRTAANPYDPEQQDGIPVFSARSVAQKPDDDGWGSAPLGAEPDRGRPTPQRRQADADLDDGLEDEDEDEYKSGSSPRESIENPSYGESSRAARDGDEIEDFFDRHLGPPQEATAADESAASVTRQEAPAHDPDTDDQYEAAASSPLSSIFHSLLHGSDHQTHKHKRPFLHLTTTSASDETDSSTATTPNESATASSSASATSGSLKASQSAPGYVEAAPIALAFTPVAPSEQIIRPEPGRQAEPDQQYSASAAPEPPAASGVREIYIGRRPTVMKYLQQAYGPPPPTPPGYSAAGSSQIWRGAPGRQQVVYEQEQQGDYAQPHITAPYGHQREQPGAAASTSSQGGAGAADDEQTVTYGLSFAGSPAVDEGATSAAPGEQGDWQAGGGQAEEVEQGPQQQEQAEGPGQQLVPGYVPYNARYSASSTRAYNNYHNNLGHQYAASGPHYRPNYVRAMAQPRQRQMVMVPQSVAYQQQQQPQHYPRAGSTRYHQDPSELSGGAMRPAASPYQQQAYYSSGYQQAGPAHYSGSRGRGSGRKRKGDDDDDEADETRVAERQRLLASLDKEIKASPQYRAHGPASAAATLSVAQTGGSSHGRRPLGSGDSDSRQRVLAFKSVKKSFRGNDLNSYNSFHREEDPHKTFTSHSRMINDPTGLLLASARNLPGSVPASNSESTQGATGALDGNQQPTGPDPDNNQAQPINANLLTGPLSNSGQSASDFQLASQQRDLLRNSNDPNNSTVPADSNDQSASAGGQDVPNSRVRREDADEREIDNDVDEDGVWVDDDEDDDSRQQSSDLNETAQEPEGEEEEDGGQDGLGDGASSGVQQQMNPPGVIGGPHGYELSPNDLMIYHG